MVGDVSCNLENRCSRTSMVRRPASLRFVSKRLALDIVAEPRSVSAPVYSEIHSLGTVSASAWLSNKLVADGDSARTQSARAGEKTMAMLLHRPFSQIQTYSGLDLNFANAHTHEISVCCRHLDSKEEETESSIAHRIRSAFTSAG